MRNKTFKLTYTAIFIALIFLFTAFPVIPIAVGYVNLGDAFVLISSMVLGPLYGGIAAALGSALADLYLSYTLYIPATAIIKFLMAICVFFFYRKIFKNNNIGFVVGCSASEIIMIAGYFIYESFLYGISTASVTLIPNLIQGLSGIVVSSFIFFIMKKYKLVINKGD